MTVLKVPSPDSDLRFDMQINQGADQAGKNVANAFDAGSEIQVETLRVKEIVRQAKPKNECRGDQHHIGGGATGWPADQKKEQEQALRAAREITAC
ncbi:hypothetical protein [Telmatospirillum sp.]|uniref:hypothetical protein n=1 Tax=Telmatospirillum sp. TaxID=2079197 RepID=UPI0028456D43|nr:hypothetical protein [Telmatospirillum sp.]MDR3435723.1 hypothetical protein [Telmatospirillum sp.]